MSLSILTGGCFFDKGITVAVFHSFGSTPSLRELLNIAVTGAARRCEHSFNAHGGILSELVALITLMLSSAYYLVSLTLMVNLAGSGSLMSKMGCVARSLGKSSLIDTKQAFIRFRVSIFLPVNAFAKPSISF